VIRHQWPSAGPPLEPDQPLPCGCRLTRAADGRLRLWYCRTHGAAFEMLEALRVSAEAPDSIVKRPPGPDLSRRAHAAARDALLKVRPWPTPEPHTRARGR
jgi:hypothetical protein